MLNILTTIFHQLMIMQKEDSIIIKNLILLIEDSYIILVL